MFHAYSDFPLKEFFYRPEIAVVWIMRQPLKVHFLTLGLLTLAALSLDILFRDLLAEGEGVGIRLSMIVGYIVGFALFLPLMIAVGSVLVYWVGKLLGGKARLLDLCFIGLYLSFPALLSIPFSESRLVSYLINGYEFYLYFRSYMFIQQFTLARTFALVGILFVIGFILGVLIGGLMIFFGADSMQGLSALS